MSFDLQFNLVSAAMIAALIVVGWSLLVWAMTGIKDESEAPLYAKCSDDDCPVCGSGR